MKSLLVLIATAMTFAILSGCAELVGEPIEAPSTTEASFNEDPQAGPVYYAMTADGVVIVAEDAEGIVYQEVCNDYGDLERTYVDGDRIYTLENDPTCDVQWMTFESPSPTPSSE
jgi:hypothetical protein